MKVMLVATILFLLVSYSKTNYAQAPNFGAATGFALFTSNGAVTNSTTTTLTGNVGTNLGSISGFDPPTVVNGIFYTQDDTTALAALDLATAYNQLLNTPTTMAHAAAFGTETVLAGVYSIGGAGSVGGNLTLDAAGDANAVFIFKFNGAFTAGAASNIILANGALAGNVFWVAEGAISIAANVSMKGTLIAHDGANSLGTSSSLEGRLLSTAGAIDVSFNTIAKPTSGGYVPVPITLLSFTGLCTNQNVLLKWITETEYNNKYFTLERSVNLMDWKVIKTINGSVNSSEKKYYQFLDSLQTSGDFYYRLKQTDIDGKYTYSSVIAIKNCGASTNQKLIIYPNPSGQKFNLNYQGDKREVKLTQVFNISGEKVFEAKGFQKNIDLTNNPPALYYIRLVTKDQVFIKDIWLSK